MQPLIVASTYWKRLRGVQQVRVGDQSIDQTASTPQVFGEALERMAAVNLNIGGAFCAQPG
jgi:hypothetical protein